MELDELRTKLCQQYSSDAEAADAIATANAAVARCPKCGSDKKEMLAFECFRDDEVTHPWHHSALADATGEPYTTPGHPDSIGQD